MQSQNCCKRTRGRFFQRLLDGARAHRKVQAENSDVVGQQYIESLLSVTPAPAVAVAVYHDWQGMLWSGPRWFVMAALQLQSLFVDLQHKQAC